MKSKRTNGFSTLEVVIGLLLSAPLLATLALSIHNAALWRIRLELAITEQRAVQRIESIIKDGIDASDYTAFLPTPRIHQAGTITLTDGTPNAIMHASGPSKPSNAADAITFAKPLLLEAQRVLRADNPGGVITYQSCPRYPVTAQQPFSQYKSFLLIKPEGVFEASLNSHFWKLDDNGRSCWISTVTSAPKSMIATSTDTPSDLSNVRLLLPIDELYTLYLDQRGQFRYLHHQGEVNIENQPLLNGVSSITFVPQSLGRAFGLRTEILFPSGRSTLNFSANHIARTSHLNLLLNS